MSTPLTCLSDDETMFRDAVRDFAAAEVRPRVDQMERAAAFDRSLLPEFAELGLMGIDVPTELGGAGGSLLGGYGYTKEYPVEKFYQLLMKE